MKWLSPEWPAPAVVRALSTLRGGGVSKLPYASLNLGSHVLDSAAAVAENRSALRAAAALPAEPAWLNQVHGIEVQDLDSPDSAATADAAVTRQAGRVCVILTADCLPVLFASIAGDRVGAAHAGWRGLAAGVLESTVQALAVPPRELMAWLGPAIGPQRFEVGSEVRDALLCGDPESTAAFKPNHRNRFTADLYALARSRLRRLGIESVYGGGSCTYTESDRFFSHRRDGLTGRQATFIWLTPPPHR